jgi:hypothetical protein
MALLLHMSWFLVTITIPLLGSVVDAAGRPVAGASVWLGDTTANRHGPDSTTA